VLARRGGARARAEQVRDCSVANPRRGDQLASFHDTWKITMNETTRDMLLKAALVVFGITFFLVYPLGLVWPSGWVWHGGEGKYYLQMICGIYAVLGAFLLNAARNPAQHRSLIWFTIWSSIVHALIMAAQSVTDAHETGHLVGDVPSLLLVAVVLWLLLPAKQAGAVTA
jgi:hypothetical protein